MLHCLSVMLKDGEIGDLAIDDLRQWQMWDLTKEILAVYEKPSHASPIARNNIIRYALCCTQPEAERFVAALSKRDPELVAQVRESLESEKLDAEKVRAHCAGN